MLEALWTTGHRVPWWCFQAVACVVGAALVARERRRAPSVDRSAWWGFGLAVALAALGAMIVANGGEWAAWAAHGLRGPAPELEVAGFGALAGLIGGYLLVSGADPAAGRALARAIGPMLSIARLGCFFAGCDFGAPTTMPWGLRYPHWTPAFATQLDARWIDASSAMTLPVHPTQLYESVLGVLVFLIARRRPSLTLVVATYAVGRFAIDFFRGDQGHGALGLTTSQLLAIAALGLVIFQMARRSGSLPRGCAGPTP